MTEALHPYNVFRDAGFEVDLVSETGSYQADWLSQQEDWLKGEDRKVWEDPNSEFRKKLDAHLKPSDIDASKVGGNLSFPPYECDGFLFRAKRKEQQVLCQSFTADLRLTDLVWHFLRICGSCIVDRLPGSQGIAGHCLENVRKW